MHYTTFAGIFETLRYPAGESHLRLRADVALDTLEVVEAPVRGFEDLGQVLTGARILAHNRRPVRWFIPYFPFARHDRRIDARDGLELELALQWVRDLDLTIADPHSDVAGVLRHIPQAAAVRCFEAAGLFEDDPLVVIPDAGATKKAFTWLGGRDFLQAGKRRDPHTGALSGFALPEGDLADRPCVMVDDICDGGGTFLGLADALAARGAGPLTLAVTHGLFTHGTQDLAKVFERIFSFATEAATDATLCALPYRTLYAQGETV